MSDQYSTKHSWKKMLASIFALMLLSSQALGVAYADTAEPLPSTEVQQPVAEPQLLPSEATPEPAPVPTSPPVTLIEPEANPAPTAASTPETGPTGPTGPNVATGPGVPTGKIPTHAFDSSIRKWVPTVTSSFSWNPTSGLYESPLYRYDPTIGWYFVIPQSQPASALASLLAASSESGGSSGLMPLAGPVNTSNPAAALASLLGLTSLTNSNTGPDSQNSISAGSTSELLLQALTAALINNLSNSTAISGDASVSSNTIGGDATSGAASIVENLFNLINAAWSWTNGGLAYFAQNLLGDHYGDITIDPGTSSQASGGGQLGSYNPLANLNAVNSGTGPDSTNTIDAGSSGDITVINRPSGTINNDLNLLAMSGSADVTENTKAGNATTGDASIGVNIMNLINSAISSGNSFFGLLNIFGSLNGDILFPDGFLDSVMQPNSGSGSGGTTASNQNTGPDSTNTIGLDSLLNANVTNSPSGYFNNNLNAQAQSGSATVERNTSAGSATTGNAATNNNLFNLFNTMLSGENAVLVLVNVMGNWVGRIMTLPQASGSTGALLTGDTSIQNLGTGPGSQNNINSDNSLDLDIENSPTALINNNINAGAISGDATVSRNTLAGNATSGNASIATNIANIFGSQLNLTNWFGVLVINVFGDWTGSVAEDTEAGESTRLPSSVRGFLAVADQGVGGGSTWTSFAGDILGNGSSQSGNNGDSSAAVSSGNAEDSTTNSNEYSALVASALDEGSSINDDSSNSVALALLAASALLMSGAILRLRKKVLN